ncbi:MAG: oligosaccharide flippase family protein [Nitrososphaerales archaeon]
MTDRTFDRLARGSYYLILTNFTNLAIGAIFWIIMAKIVDPASVGQAMVVIALATGVIGFTGYGVQVTISKYISEYNARNMKGMSRKVLKLGISLALGVSGIAGLSIALLSGHIAQVAFNNPSLSNLLTFAAIIYIPSQTLIAALAGAFQGSQKMHLTFITYLVYEITRLTLAVALVLEGLSSFGILIGFCIGSVAASLLGYLYLLPKAVPKTNEGTKVDKGSVHILKFSGLNYFSVGMRTLSAQIGVLVLGTQSFEWAAFYGISVLIANVVGGILVAVSRAILPTASEEWTRGKKDEFMKVFNTAIRISLLISGFGFLIFMIDPGYVLGILSKSYIEASSALRILVISSIINAIGLIMISLLNAADRAAVVAKIGLLSSSCIIVLTFVLSPMMGLDGAAVSMLVGSSLGLLLAIVMLRKEERVTISINSVVKPALSISVGLFVGFMLFALLHNIIIAIAIASLSYALFSLGYRATNHNEIKRLLAIVLRTMKT